MNTRYLIAAVLPVALAACGGGGSETETASAQYTEQIQEMAEPAATTASGIIQEPESVAENIKTVYTENFENASGAAASGWYVNYWGGAQSQYQIDTTSPISGARSQKFTVFSRGTGDAELIRPLTFAQGKRYRVTFTARASAPTTVTGQIRLTPWPYSAYGMQSKTVGTTPVQFVVEGIYGGTGAGALRFSVANTGVAVWVDNVVVQEVDGNPLKPYTSAPVPASLFGMQVNRLGVHGVWPALGQKIIRLSDTGTNWYSLEPCDNCWDFNNGSGRRLDMYVNYVKQNDPSAQILYELGFPAAWASTTPTADGHYGLGTSGAAKNMTIWRRYVRTLAQRYKGKIKYWELWNEASDKGFYGGTVEQMVQMAATAREELKLVDPENKLVGPSIGTNGTAWLNSFLAAGGNKYLDIVAFHFYYGIEPEKFPIGIANVRLVMQANGVGNLPLWNTEGSGVCSSTLIDCAAYSNTALTDPVRRGATVRALALMWTGGVANFMYNSYEGIDPNWGLVSNTDYRTPTIVGQGYRAAVNWMLGNSLVAAYKNAQGLYVFKMTTPAGRTQYLVWSGAGNQSLAAPSSWGITKVAKLDGSTQTIPAGSAIPFSVEPVLLQQ